MSERIRFEMYKGRKVLVVDFTSLSGQAVLDLIAEAENFMISSEEQKLLYLLNIKDAKGSPEVIDAYKHFSKRMADIIWKDAVVGVSKLQKILMDTIRDYAGVALPEFETKEEAMDYLVAPE
jgi:hypothetical protein